MPKILIDSLIKEYSDLDMSFKIHPLYSDIVPVYELDALRNSIKNILLTKPGERPFNPLFGCNLADLLFEPMDVLTTTSIREIILSSLKLHEPRIKVEEVDIVPDHDRNAYEITITATIVNISVEVEIALILERLK